MRRVLVLHSAYGLRVAIREAEARLTFAGHEVRAPDLYGGRTASTVADALALRDQLGRDTLLAEAAAFAEAWSPDAYVGFSMGASFAQHIALRRGVPARLVLFGGVGAAPSAPCPWLAAQAHVAVGDRFAPDDELAAWQAAMAAAGATIELHRYPGGHIFMDSGLPDFDAGATERAWATALTWLA